MIRVTVGALLLLLAGCASGGAGPGSERGDRSVIQRAEMETSTATNAYALIQSRRPNWLRTRGTQSFREQGQVRGQGEREAASVVPGELTIVVYLDNAKLGSINELRGVALDNVRYIRFLDAAAATQRWGGGHTHGAILVSTVDP
jgi:hypothetical protein